MSDYIEINKNAWNLKTEIHIESDFYENEAFLITFPIIVLITQLKLTQINIKLIF